MSNTQSKSIFSSSDIAMRFRSGLIWNVASTVLTQGGTLLVNIIVARILGKVMFGEYSLLQSTLLAFSGIAQVATGMAATKFVAEYRSVNKILAGRILGLFSLVTFFTGCVATLILMLCAPIMASDIWSAPHLAIGLWLSSAFVLFSVMNGYQAGALAGLEGYKALTIVGAIHFIVQLIICSIFVIKWGLNGVLVGFSISAFFRWAITGWILNREAAKHDIVISRSLDVLQEKKILIHFALPGVISGLSTLPAIWFGNTILARQQGGYAELAIYIAANNLRVVMLMLPILLNSVGMVLLNNKLGAKDGNGYRDVFRSNIRMTVALSLSGILIMLMLGTWVLDWYGRDFSAHSTKIILVLAIAILPEALSTAYYHLIQSQGRMWVSFFLVTLPRDIAMVGLAFLLVPALKGVGLALAYMLSWLLALVLLVVIIAKLKLNKSII